MTGSKTLLTKLFGDKEQAESERYFVTLTLFYVSLFLVILSGVHLIMNLAPELIYLSSSSAVLLFILYYWVRSGKNMFYPKLIITVLGLLLLDATW